MSGQVVMRIVTAVEQEKAAIVRGLSEAGGIVNEKATNKSTATIDFADRRFAVSVVGVGPLAAAVGTMQQLQTADLHSERTDVLISAGVAGSFASFAEYEAEHKAGIDFLPGQLLVADRMVAADLGAETEDGFLPLGLLGLGDDAIHEIAADEKWSRWLALSLACARGPILTVATVSGRISTAVERLRRWPEARAEAMEGFAVALAAAAYRVPTVEWRAVSNAVGPRRRELWRLDEAFAALTLGASRIARASLSGEVPLS